VGENTPHKLGKGNRKKDATEKMVPWHSGGGGNNSSETKKYNEIGQIELTKVSRNPGKQGPLFSVKERSRQRNVGQKKRPLGESQLRPNVGGSASRTKKLMGVKETGLEKTIKKGEKKRPPVEQEPGADREGELNILMEWRRARGVKEQNLKGEARSRTLKKEKMNIRKGLTRQNSGRKEKFHSAKKGEGPSRCQGQQFLPQSQ